MTESRPIPRATYRLQLSKSFTFRDVEAIAGYLGRLGISHAYLSPILKARPGSTHGYDTVDHTELNPELGTMDEFRAMAQALRAAGVGIVLDIVPNHMGVGGEDNRLWLDVLERGRESRYADWFDINWDPSEPTLKGKLLVPFLGSAYGEALRDGKLELRYDEAEGSFAVWAEGAHKLPIAPHTYSRISDAPLVAKAVQKRVAEINNEPGRAELAALIEAQHWRPARASVAADDINYRRFFIVSDLAAIRIERDDVFDHVHALTFQLVEEGLVDGLRVDHIDGLYDPEAYCRKLRSKCPRPVYIVVEKILAPHEALRPGWDVEGTTGYEFAGAVTRLLTDRDGEAPLTRLYEDFTGHAESLEDIERDAKLGIIDFEMAAELDALVARLRRIAASDHLTADITRNALRNALRATVASLSVYRTYVASPKIEDVDRRTIGLAIARARETTPSLDPSVFDFLEHVMTGERGGAALDVAMRIQQYTGPVMAKGLEDTALYRFNRLIALSDVGAKPDRYTEGVAAFHDFMKSRLERQPHGMLTSSSHDTKRGEDVRARLAAISGHIDAWEAGIREWPGLLAAQGAPELEPNDAYYFFQLLVGAWPAGLGEGVALTNNLLDPFRERVEQTMLKSVREARLRTNWAVPRTDYEERVAAYVKTALGAGEGNAFLASFRRFEQTIALHGALNGLIETVLKLTVPGVPDIYQGAELWEQSMVDPDNRRPVDFGLRKTTLDSTANRAPGALLCEARSGAIKVATIQRLLAARAAHPALFAQGDYVPVEVRGDDDGRVLAFQRRHGSETLLVVAALGPWRGATTAQLVVPTLAMGHELLRDRDISPGQVMRDALGDGLPVAVLIGNSG